jgi:hypothetical protein
LIWNLFSGASLGAVVAEVTANDVDTNPALTYSFTEGGNPDSTFSIDRFSGAVTLARRLDFEGRRSYELKVRASDAAHAVLTSLTVHVTDENDNTPMFEQQSYEVALSGESRFLSSPLLFSGIGRDFIVNWLRSIGVSFIFYVQWPERPVWAHTSGGTSSRCGVRSVQTSRIGITLRIWETRNKIRNLMHGDSTHFYSICDGVNEIKK